MNADANPKGKFWRGVDRLLGGGEVACEIVMVAMMLLVTVEVVCRTLFNFSLQITDEVSGYLLVAATFLGISISLKEGSLFRVDFLYARFGPRLKNSLEFLFSLFSLGFIVLAEYQIVRLIVSSIEREVTAPTLLATPLYIPQLVMPVGVALVILVLLGDTRRTFQALRSRAGEEKA